MKTRRRTRFWNNYKFIPICTGLLLLTAGCVANGTGDADGSGSFSALVAMVSDSATLENAADAVDFVGEILTLMGIGAAGGVATLAAQAMRRRAMARSGLSTRTTATLTTPSGMETTGSTSELKDTPRTTTAREGNAPNAEEEEAEGELRTEMEKKLDAVDKGALAAVAIAVESATDI